MANWGPRLREGADGIAKHADSDGYAAMSSIPQDLRLCLKIWPDPLLRRSLTDSSRDEEKVLARDCSLLSYSTRRI